MRREKIYRLTESQLVNLFNLSMKKMERMDESIEDGSSVNVVSTEKKQRDLYDYLCDHGYGKNISFGNDGEITITGDFDFNGKNAEFVRMDPKIKEIINLLKEIGYEDSIESEDGTIESGGYSVDLVEVPDPNKKIFTSSKIGYISKDGKIYKDDDVNLVDVDNPLDTDLDYKYPLKGRRGELLKKIRVPYGAMSPLMHKYQVITIDSNKLNKTLYKEDDVVKAKDISEHWGEGKVLYFSDAYSKDNAADADGEYGFLLDMYNSLRVTNVRDPRTGKVIRGNVNSGISVSYFIPDSHVDAIVRVEFFNEEQEKIFLRWFIMKHCYKNDWNLGKIDDFILRNGFIDYLRAETFDEEEAVVKKYKINDENLETMDTIKSIYEDGYYLNGNGIRRINKQKLLSGGYDDEFIEL